MIQLAYSYCNVTYQIKTNAFQFLDLDIVKRWSWWSLISHQYAHKDTEFSASVINSSGWPPLSTHSFMFWFHNWHPLQSIVIQSRYTPAQNKSLHPYFPWWTALRPPVLCHGVGAVRGAVPGVHGLDEAASWCCEAGCWGRGRPERPVTSGWRQPSPAHTTKPHILTSSQSHGQQTINEIFSTWF